uniref:GTP-binding protein, HSR1-related protein n=1 Tax=Mycolicibacterium gilvum (strain PYR-GCK) TaxID=350054 RepID=A4TAU1_MYCGI|nr:GTP-binding protein, HSR1-related protein [Mycolicibacterium gilvum PYR-GCK]
MLSEFAQMRLRFAQESSAHLSEQSRVLSTFNIAFFGRTGAGKSTLLSAFGELDGAAVSPFGESDWTTTVESIPWRGVCRLYDTPGINGWGGRKSRDELEATARRAVEIADVVLLCFDTQSQQASEFAKVADWVTHYGKPVVAVLNVRNPRWRHPARVSSQAARRNMSEPVAQHAENVRVELANIGLDDVPVVAISSRRALFARAATPYQGPAEQNFHDDRDRYGTDYLERWSNFAALESVLTACVTAGGSQLRLKSLREGIRARLIDEATSLEELRVRIGERVHELDRLTQKYLDVLGYLEPEERTRDLHDDVWHSDLLTLAESARRKPYKAPSDGSLVRQVRNLLKPHLAEARNNALRRYKDLEHQAFHEGKTIDAKTFVGRVFDDEELTGALDRVGTEAAEFLGRELSLAVVELHQRPSADFGTADLSGDAGGTADLFANLLRGGGLVGGVASIAVPFLLFSNPLGWAAAAAGFGIGAAATALQWAGGSMNRDAARQKADARAKAAREGRRAVHETFDAIERQFASGATASGWSAAAPLLCPALIELIALTNLSNDIGTLIACLRAEATSIAKTPPLHFLAAAHRLLGVSRDGANALESRSFLLGEDWFDQDESSEIHDGTTDSAGICQQRNDEDTDALRHAIREAFAHPETSAVHGWLRQAVEAAVADQAFIGVTDLAAPLPRPAVIVAGDYSAGKSSFIKRMFTEFGIDVPESLQIRADATTDEVRRYPMGSVDIVDTPGFQSRRAGHEELALAAVRDAALVVVVLHVNLLIGDTAALQAIANGTSTAAGKWPRMLFIVNRCDELGVDPLDSPAEFFNRRDRKLNELAAALQSREIFVDAAHIHGVAADPFGSVGAQYPVTAADYDANRAWDGIAALVDALRAWVDADLTRATTLAGFDKACSALLALREDTRTDITAYRDETGKHDSLIAALGICLEDADYLHRSLEHELDDVLTPSVIRAVSRIRAVALGDEKDLAEAIHSWRSTETEDEVKRFMETAAAKVNDWSATHVSAISREEAAAGFDAHLNLPGADPGGGVGDAVGQAAGVAGSVAKFGAQLGKVLGNREAALQIGHFFGHKFKPWGAIKAGKAVGRVGVVLGVVAVAADGADWAYQANKARDWDSKRDAAVEQVESDKHHAIQQLLAEPDGPWAYLNERAEQVRLLRGQYQERQRAAQQEAERLEGRLEATAELITAAQELREVAGNE